MALETLMVQVGGAKQASALSALAGKSFTVGKISTAAGGMANVALLTPTGAAAGAKSIAVQLEGARQAAQLSAFAGKTVVIGNAPAAMGGTSSWLMLHPVTGAAAAKGAVGAGVAAKGIAGKGASIAGVKMLQVEGAKQGAALASMTGKSFTVVSPMAATGTKTGGWIFLKPTAAAASKGASTAGGGKMIAFKLHQAATQLPGLAGKTFTIGKAPMVAGGTAGKWLVLQPAAGAAIKGAAAVGATGAGAAAASKAAGTAAASKTAGGAAGSTLGKGVGFGAAGKTAGIASKAAVGKGTVLAGAAGKATAGKLAMNTGAIAAGGAKVAVGGKGVGMAVLGSAGLWGPLALGLVVAAGVAGYIRQRRSSDQIQEA
jgi:hypothetical protein